MPQVQINGINFFYDIKGQGEPLLLIAGFLCDHSYWSLIMPSLTREYQVIRVDNRGMGRSSAPDHPYTIQQMANDVTALLDHIGIHQVNVVGHSMGGQIAQELVLSDPRRVKSLILLSTLAKGDGRFNSVIETWGDLFCTIDLKLYEKVVFPWIFSDQLYDVPGMVEQLIEWAINYPFPPAKHTLYHHSRAIIGSNTEDRLQNIHCPTLILVSRQDILTPVKFSEELARGIPHAELEIIDGGGHNLLIESSESVISLMRKFLSGL
ncbi:alpha/beta hydrolase [Nodularia harveyana UHCC-0300]|uniref:Alpha/beta hydrolase n=1 Tax=Nodularia harveyana UHCC-0300 TaxID=2974287 RepID=A0ABU5UI75_9CYAN|nr:alpha/beta hydrolase [Nodularia harveyana]MEA5583272.1 alpha/beta hydrolase [Nodularia harveyana UHCC-0300]